MYTYIVYKETVIRKKRTSRVLLKLKERKKKCAIFLFSLSLSLSLSFSWWRKRWWWWWKGKVEERFYFKKKEEERNYLKNYTLSGISCSYTKLNIWKAILHLHMYISSPTMYIEQTDWTETKDKEKDEESLHYYCFNKSHLLSDYESNILGEKKIPCKYSSLNYLFVCVYTLMCWTRGNYRMTFVQAGFCMYDAYEMNRTVVIVVWWLKEVLHCFSVDFVTIFPSSN